jgi:hypothetical protein
MLTLSLPSPSSFVYPKVNFGKLDNLRRQAEFNRKAFKDYVRENVFNLENEHLLVGLLQQLSIDKSWDLEYVVQYTRFRAYSLCTLFNITSLSHVGSAIDTGFYREATLEHWCLIEDDRVYNEATFDFATSYPIVPLYTTRTDHGYRHSAIKRWENPNPPKHLAVIGLNLVELAVGWWKYMRDPQYDDTGTSAYVCYFGLVNAQLIHNQMAVFNVLYEHMADGKPLDELIKTNDVTFITVSESKLLKEYVEFLVDRFNGNRLMDLNHLMVQIQSIYKQPYFNYVRAGKSALFSQTCWVWEIQIMKLYALYLTIANNKGYKAADINTVIDRSHAARYNNYQRIPEKIFRNHFEAMADNVFELNKLNV